MAAHPPRQDSVCPRLNFHTVTALRDPVPRRGGPDADEPALVA